MRLQGTWKCPYCGFENSYHVEEPWNHPHLAICQVEGGGCARLVVLDVKEICVEFRVRRVEGEGQEDPETVVSMIAPKPAPFHVNNRSAIVEAGVVEPMRGPLNMRILSAHAALSDVVTRLEGESCSFASLQKETRIRLIAIYGEALAVHIGKAPTMGDWNEYRAAWMPSASAIQQSYDLADQGWKGMANEWFDNGKAQ